MKEIISDLELKSLKGLGENYWHVLDVSAVTSQENSDKNGKLIIHILRE